MRPTLTHRLQSASLVLATVIALAGGVGLFALAWTWGPLGWLISIPLGVFTAGALGTMVSGLGNLAAAWLDTHRPAHSTSALAASPDPDQVEETLASLALDDPWSLSDDDHSAWLAHVRATARMQLVLGSLAGAVMALGVGLGSALGLLQIPALAGTGSSALFVVLASLGVAVLGSRVDLDADDPGIAVHVIEQLGGTVRDGSPPPHHPTRLLAETAGPPLEDVVAHGTLPMPGGSVGAVVITTQRIHLLADLTGFPLTLTPNLDAEEEESEQDVTVGSRRFDRQVVVVGPPDLTEAPGAWLPGPIRALVHALVHDEAVVRGETLQIGLWIESTSTLSDLIEAARRLAALEILVAAHVARTPADRLRHAVDTLPPEEGAELLREALARDRRVAEVVADDLTAWPTRTLETLAAHADHLPLAPALDRALRGRVVASPQLSLALRLATADGRAVLPPLAITAWTDQVPRLLDVATEHDAVDLERIARNSTRTALREACMSTAMRIRETLQDRRTRLRGGLALAGDQAGGLSEAAAPGRLSPTDDTEP